MPATRRNRTPGGAGGGPVMRGSQSTISFGGTRSKVTKPASTPVGKGDGKLASIGMEAVGAAASKDMVLPIDVDETKVEPGHMSSMAAVAQQVRVELVRPKTAEEEQAGRISDGKIQRYWSAREAERIAPRVSLLHKSTHLSAPLINLARTKSLLTFTRPCIGIARMKRWVRAHKLGLHPPLEVLAVLLKEDKESNPKIERAHVDELMSSKFLVGEA
ncbi:MAG: hypothetical protein M1818_001871 [Claussenomyces sp. TS43310]|nr:MAG: hypothetical protein M1818_001871 [Claussenomyces sp. TS43310]